MGFIMRQVRMFQILISCQYATVDRNTKLEPVKQKLLDFPVAFKFLTLPGFPEVETLI